jgi:Ni,Fe-hydrogenase III large subunit
MPYRPDRSQYPSERPDGNLDLDLASGKYLKLWQGPQHSGITGNMSVELTVRGDEVVEGKTQVANLHRGFEKPMEGRTFIQCFPIVCRICRTAGASPAINHPPPARRLCAPAIRANGTPATASLQRAAACSEG